MSTINILDKNIAELIAAGEVIERPASIVKELVENSIDALSTKITIEIKNGGINLIRVADNGCGIEKGDIKKAFLRHATSKIQTKDDLNNILTLGFRGEALASICAVSNCSLVSRTSKSSIGNVISVSGGEIQEQQEAGCEKGTTITVENLFYNTPARMKFLKKDVSEANAVASFVEKLALSHPEIAFKFIRDDKIILNTTGNGDLFACIYAVIGKEFANNLMPLAYELNGIKVSGFISKPEKARGNRAMEIFFINGRYFRSKTVMAALEEGYKNSVMTGRFPGCVLFITIVPELCDCNVHPQKLEVRFANEKPIFHCVFYGVKQAVNQHKAVKEIRFSPQSSKTDLINETLLFDKSIAAHNDIQQKNIFKQQPSENFKQEKQSSASQFIQNIKNDFFPLDNDKNNDIFKSDAFNTVEDTLNHNHIQPCPSDFIVKRQDIANVIIEPPEDEIETDSSINKTHYLRKSQEKTDQNAKEINSIISEENNIFKNHKVIGEAFKTYIIVQQNDDIIFIDKHAAHERILFEELKTRNEIQSQGLLNPEIINLSPEEFNVIMENTNELKDKAFIIEEFGNNSIIIRQFPAIIKQKDIKDVVCEIAGNLLNHRFDKNYSKLDWIYHSMACRGAIKANDTTAFEELEELTDRVLTCDNIQFCPHGRPIKISISKKEIEKLFGRIQ